ncbi:MAG: hypothetical protein AAF502_25635, partial [Bacteroidota bacterium]
PPPGGERSLVGQGLATSPNPSSRRGNVDWLVSSSLPPLTPPPGGNVDWLVSSLLPPLTPPPGGDVDWLVSSLLLEEKG